MKNGKRLAAAILIVALCCVWAAMCNGAGTLSPLGSGLSPVTIKSHDVKVTINNGFAITEVVQQFNNQNKQKTEAVYSFPLPQSASLSEVSVMVGEKIINGEVVDKKKAEEIYGKEKAKGNNAGLAEKNSYQDFKFKVSNINPGEDVTIKFVYYQPLKLDTGVGRYLYPLEEGNTDEAAVSFWERSEKVEGKTTISVELKSAWPVANVRVPGCGPAMVDDKLKDGSFKATYELKNGISKDFVFYYRLQDNLPGRLEVIPYRNGKGEGTFMMVVTPGLDLKPLNNGADYVFVLDVSGSMTGGKIRTLSEGVAKVLGKMKPQDRFKIVTFESNSHDLTGGWISASNDNVNKWIPKVKAIKAGGSTNLYAGLCDAFKDLDDDRATSVILVTDAVTNTGIVKPKRFYAMMKKYDVRIFGFLLGNSGNWPLMRTICNATGGYYAGVSNSDDIIGKIMQAKKKVVYECLHDAEIKISGVKTMDLTGQNIGKIYCGEQLVIFGRYEHGGRAKVTLKAKLTGQDKTYSTTFEFPDTATDNPELERLWAMSRIEMFEDMSNAGLMPVGESKNIVRDLGIKYQLVTDETSMLVLSDDTFKQYGIERRNQQRLAVEHKAQAKRATAPVQNYRVDNGKKNKRMFDFKAPRLGGGAIGPFGAIIMLLTGMAACFGLAVGKHK